MADSITFSALKEKQRAIRSDFPETMGLRVHRAISWIGRAEACGDDHDARFIFLWIAFNAAYAREFQAAAPGDRTAFDDFFGKLVAQDKTGRIHTALWQRFMGPVRRLMDNHFIFSPFWQHCNGIDGFEDWKERFRRSSQNFAQILKRRDSARVLKLVFGRLYVLRNQLIHGSATWNSSVNRKQVRDGAAVLNFLMPVFVDLIMENPHENWGQPLYPVVRYPAG